MIVEEIKGNLLDTEIKFIAHGVNCQNVMGSGVAKALYTKHPEVKKAYHSLNKKLVPEVCTKKELLGIVQPVVCSETRTVYNCFTQEFYGRDKKIYVDYKSIKDVFEALTKILNTIDVFEIAIPKIGCGLAGGSWEIVKELIDEATGDLLDVYVYYL